MTDTLREAVRQFIQTLGQRPELLGLIVVVGGFLTYMHVNAKMADRAAQRQEASTAEQISQFVAHMEKIDLKADVRIDSCHDVQMQSIVAMTQATKAQEDMTQAQEQTMTKLEDNTEAVKEMTEELRRIR